MKEFKISLDDDALTSPEEVLENMRANGEISEEVYKELKFRFEDIDDTNKLNRYQAYKKAYANNRINKCVEVLLELGETEPDTFKRGLLLSNALKSPMSLNFNENEFKKVLLILSITLEQTQKREYSEVFIESLLEVLLYNDVFYHNNFNNTKKLNENKFSNYSLSKQLRLICIFIQDQSRLMQKQLLAEHSKQPFVTGMEKNVASRAVDNNPTQKISFADNYEGLLDSLDILIKYLYAVKKSDLKKDDVIDHGDIHAFNLPEFQEMTYIAQQRAMYESLEEKFRYSEWRLEREEQNGQKIYVFSPKHKDKYKAHLVASIRREYQHYVNMIKHSDKETMQEVMKSIGLLAMKMNLDAVENFHMNIDLFRKASLYTETIISVYKSLSKKFYFECVFNKMTINDILLMYGFLYTYSQVYITATQSNFDEEDYSSYKYLVPVINIEYLVDEFSNVYDMQKDKSKKLLRYFIYDENIRSNSGDIFSRPLIKINDNQILFCESLIAQMNLERFVEKILQIHNVVLNPVGKEFEKKLTYQLKKIETIQVNTNSISFQAYDGKDVEFDFLGTLEDSLLLFEFKSVLIPYDYVEVYKRENSIKEGIGQIQRRCEIIKHDWDKIRERVNIELPEKPYSDDKIIKVVCTNIYDFTTLKIDGIRITDESTLLKYFADPIVGLYSTAKEASEMLDAELIWKEGSPTVKEFLEYLDKPVTVGNIPDCLDDEFKMVPAFEGDYFVGFMDVIQAKDPFREAINKKLQVLQEKSPQ
ncbi:hypothetical protein [Desulfitobacterium sp. PCE1]|uniref:hypothetical protein n=1 Tax=Desulfitobacterium sp. PCE1 TaxID=146907 RepID=UPI000364DAF3|nr:hypothetical protein [Desulfitobacterium sp. PCE1]